MGGFSFKVLGHHHSAGKLAKRAPNASCSTGGFYKSPTSGQTLNASLPVNITWDTTCLNTTAADIYLYAPHLNTSLIQMFQSVNYAAGSYEAALKAKWWNFSSSVDLQLTIVPTNTPPFLSQFPAGPIWHVNYTAPPSGTPSQDSNSNSGDPNVTVVNNLPGAKSTGKSKGAIAAAVLVPIIVIALALGAYMKWTRTREAARRKRWSEAVDKRMSALSMDWRKLPKDGAEAAIRASFAGTRASMARSSMVGGPRPSSTFAVENDDTPSMTQIRRPGVGLRGPIPSTASASRQSRISFAADTRFSRASTAEAVPRGRPSVESRRAGVPSRAFHSAYIPPLPTRQDNENGEREGSDSEESGAMSPTQRDGPLALSAADIRARVQNMNASSDQPRPSIDEIAPALSMMRTGNESHADLLIKPKAEEIPAAQLNVETVAVPPAAAIPKSPIVDAMPMQPLSGGMMMSPDDMVRAYAERRRTGASTTTGTSGSSPLTISFPMPIASPISPNGRPGFAPNGGVQPQSNNPFVTNEPQGRRSNETQHYDNEDAYFGTAA